MEALLVKALFGVLGLFGGAKALENMLENYLMSRVPQWAKPLVVPIVSFVFAVALNVHGGMAWDQALAAGFALWGGTAYIHDNPNTTSADWALPNPPKEADGVPG